MDNVTASEYDRELKRQCMYKVLQEYGQLLRPSLFPDDATFVLLATMCKMIDRSKEITTSSTSGPAVVWSLDSLKRDFEKLESGVASTAQLSPEQRRELLEKFVIDSEYV